MFELVFYFVHFNYFINRLVTCVVKILYYFGVIRRMALQGCSKDI